MANEIFVDTSEFYSLLVKAEDRHEASVRNLRGAQRRKRLFVTTAVVLAKDGHFYEAGFVTMLK